MEPDVRPVVGDESIGLPDRGRGVGFRVTDGRLDLEIEVETSPGVNLLDGEPDARLHFRAQRGDRPAYGDEEPQGDRIELNSTVIVGCTGVVAVVVPVVLHADTPGDSRGPDTDAAHLQYRSTGQSLPR